MFIDDIMIFIIKTNRREEYNMKVVLVSVIFVMIAINIICYIYGKKYLKRVQESEENSEENYKKGMRYIIIASVISFLTIVSVSIVAILNIWA